MSDSEIIPVTLQDRRAPNPYRKPFLILVTAICLSLLAGAFSSWLTWSVAHDTNTIVQDLHRRNSPETRVAQQKYLEEIIRRVDCNSRKAIEEAFVDIADENPGFFNEIDITSEVCGQTTTTIAGS